MSMKQSRLLPWASIFLTTITSFSAFAEPLVCRMVLSSPSAYKVQRDIISSNLSRRLLKDGSSQMQTAFGSKKQILRSFEKEGLYYEEIAEWFPDVKASSRVKINDAFTKAVSQTKGEAPVTKWLRNSELNPLAPIPMRAHWKAMTPEQKWNFLHSRKDFFLLLTMRSRSELFMSRVLDFNDMIVGPKAPTDVIVGDDGGSYEVRLAKAIPDRNQFHLLRDQVEQFLKGKIGHQHLFHGWPDSPGLRKYIAPYYIELLDSSSWYLYWRQIKRNPEDATSILTHPYLGVYSTNSLERLNSAVETGDAKAFKDKYRMVGARAFPPLKEYAEEQGEAWVTDWELRSGNKGIRRDFVESILEARLVTGDYSGLKDFRDYEFNTLATIKELTAGVLSPQEIGAIESFESAHPKMKFSQHTLAKNHYRTRIVSPLLPWARRLNLEFKKEAIAQAQAEYARGLAKVAQSYNAKLAKGPLNGYELGELNSMAIKKLEVLIFEFAQKARLDLDFERYLRPVSDKVPSVLVASTSPIDVNKIALGIEYSFRFPFEARPQSKPQAAALIESFADRLSQNYQTQRQNDSTQGGADSHGHGVVVKQKVLDRTGETWRVEWDGVIREYNDKGKVTNARGGHIEVVSPKFVPVAIAGPVADLYATARSRGMAPSRAAGGAHVNFDIKALENQMTPEKGTRALLNLVTLFENESDVILHLWQHPHRKHAAFPVQMNDQMRETMESFHGDWSQLGRMLYQVRYFNSFVGRKPKYVPLNLTSVMTDFVPTEYIDRTLDIKNPKAEWFPNFNRVYERGEARFFDAPIDETMAALQIKYWRALMNKAFSNPAPLHFLRSQELAQRAKVSGPQLWKTDAILWKKAAEDHLVSLGLDPKEFQGLIWDSFLIQNQGEPSVRDYQIYNRFLPPRD
jgi:hypothetical protein